MKTRPLCVFAKQRKTFRERLPMSEITNVVSPPANRLFLVSKITPATSLAARSQEWGTK